MYIVMPAVPQAAPVFRARTFQQTVRWCLAAQKEGQLEYDTYVIVGAESRLDDPELAATFEPDSTIGCHRRAARVPAGDRVVSDLPNRGNSSVARGWSVSRPDAYVRREARLYACAGSLGRERIKLE
jgi:hypothetical protein